MWNKEIGEMRFCYETLARNAISGSAGITEERVAPSGIVVHLVFHTACAAPSAFGSSPRQGSQDAGCDSVGVMFHVKHDSDEKSTSVLSPPTGEN